MNVLYFNHMLKRKFLLGETRIKKRWQYDIAPGIILKVNYSVGLSYLQICRSVYNSKILH